MIQIRFGDNFIYLETNKLIPSKELLENVKLSHKSGKYLVNHLIYCFYFTNEGTEVSGVWVEFGCGHKANAYESQDLRLGC